MRGERGRDRALADNNADSTEHVGQDVMPIKYRPQRDAQRSTDDDDDDDVGIT